jgi:2-polyprenyl-3-methyl-5-hydroxy-6-metoxy-1,4-benzoquinol methylase
MTGQELGLALGQQLLGIDDLHYGLWDDELELSFDNLAVAQRRFANLIASELPDPAQNETHVLDVGCGSGHILALLTQQGYQIDAVSPSSFLISRVKRRLADLADSTSKVFELKFEDFPEQIYQQYYDVIFFNESFSHIPMQRAFPKTQKLLKPGGLVIICDLFSAEQATAAVNNAMQQPLDEFYRWVEQSPFTLLRDDDITEYVAPNVALLDDFLKTRLKPAGQTISQYLQTNNPVLSKIGSFLFRRTFMQLDKQYFTSTPNEALLNGSLRYRFIVLQLVKPV